MSIEQTVYCKEIGEGEALILLHGWGVNSAVWQPVLDTLSQHFTVFIIDLPGFGNSAPLNDYSLKTISEAILNVVPDSAIWCGWSLGGLVATYTALNYPKKVRKLIQVASSVKFVASDNWSGVEATIFDDFLAGLMNNPTKTLTRFIGLQAMGCDSARKDTLMFKKLLSATKMADYDALIAGLKLLAESDMRDSLTHLSSPCLSLFGQFDTLVPLQARADIEKLLPSIQTQLFENSSHAPFMSEPDLFCQRLIKFSNG